MQRDIVKKVNKCYNTFHKSETINQQYVKNKITKNRQGK